LSSGTDRQPPLSQALRLALESDCANGVEDVLREHRLEDLAALRSLVSVDPTIKPSHRQNAVYLLGRWPDPDSAALIRNVMRRLDERERINAVDSLGRLRNDEARTGVMEATRDASPDVRRFAAYALARLRGPDEQARLAEMASSDPVEFVRESAARAQKE
jgi:HEAT repeat protein